MAEERTRVEALEEKLRLVQESTRGDATARDATAAELERTRAALARAEAKMARMARDLAEAEEELEERDKAAEAAGGRNLPRWRWWRRRRLAAARGPGSPGVQ